MADPDFREERTMTVQTEDNLDTQNNREREEQKMQRRFDSREDFEQEVNGDKILRHKNINDKLNLFFMSYTVYFCSLLALYL